MFQIKSSIHTFQYMKYPVTLNITWQKKEIINKIGYTIHIKIVMLGAGRSSCFIRYE